VLIEYADTCHLYCTELEEDEEEDNDWGIQVMENDSMLPLNKSIAAPRLVREERVTQELFRTVQRPISCSEETDAKDFVHDDEYVEVEGEVEAVRALIE
jgi:hypothetical protein